MLKFRELRTIAKDLERLDSYKVDRKVEFQFAVFVVALLNAVDFSLGLFEIYEEAGAQRQRFVVLVLKNDY